MQVSKETKHSTEVTDVNSNGTELPGGWRPAPAGHYEQSNDIRSLLDYPSEVCSEPLPKHPEFVSALFAHANCFQLGLVETVPGGGALRKRKVQSLVKLCSKCVEYVAGPRLFFSVFRLLA